MSVRPSPVAAALVRVCVLPLAALGLAIASEPLVAQVRPDRVLERPEIYSPYVERTVANADFA
jgi:hypothetical protein